MEISLEEIQFPPLSPLHLIHLDFPAGKTLPSFDVGQVLWGKVTEVIDEHHAVIQMGGVDLSVKNRMPLERGMEGHFEVKSVYPHIVLKLLQPERVNLLEASRWLKSIFITDPSTSGLSERLTDLWKTGAEGVSPAVRETMGRLMSLWNAFSVSQSSAIEPGQIQEMIARSGLFFEHRLGQLVKTRSQHRFEEVLGSDVKGLLAQLKVRLETSSSFMPTTGSSVNEELLDGVHQLLQRIENHQWLSSSPSEGTQEKFFLLLPLWVEERLQLIDLHLSLPSSGSDRPGSEEISLLFLLDLPEWGKMSIQVRMMGKRIDGRFFFSSDEAASFIGRALDGLRMRLQHLGFQPEMHVSTQTPEKIVELFLSDMKGNDESLLNLVV
ncbi:MAG: flagellar hook-length control protein FliK [Deltaproteobacteria bacterium]|nr:flagellar hook-length control protein FliK [Deltaproteobacteria bacterium]